MILRVRYTLNPPEKVVFVPQSQPGSLSQQRDLPAPQVKQIRQAPTPTLAALSTLSQQQGVEELPAATPTATPAPLPTQTRPPLPERVSLAGVRYEDQHGRYNYCAPANLAMALSFWGWNGNRDTVGPILKPDPKDKNVMPYEMAAYVTENTDLQALTRVAGSQEILKQLIAAGYPVLIEKGAYLTDLTGVKSWMGHYLVVTGYDDSAGVFLTQDSFLGADREVPYEALNAGWRAFNYQYIVIYPPERENDVLAFLGPDADEVANFQNAAQKASDEIFSTAGIDRYFAWFNRGSSLVQLQDYMGAAQAYDEAFAVYPSIPEAERPWRMLWYQTGPYFAYFYSERWYDVLNLADTTLNAMQSDKNLEESYYWRGMAKKALGDTSGAIQDFQTSLVYHPGFSPSVIQLNLLGAPVQ